MRATNEIRINFGEIGKRGIKSLGFMNEFTGEDFEKFQAKEVFTGSYKNNNGKENLFYEKNSGAILLKPNIEPIDMLFDDTEGKGDWFELEENLSTPGLKLGSIYPAGSPRRQCIYQNAVMNGTTGEPVKWTVKAGKNCGYNGLDYFLENQGAVIWIGNNFLPKNTENKLIFSLVRFDGEPNKQYDNNINGIYVEIIGGKTIKLAHYIDIERKGTIPPQREIQTQWYEGQLPLNKPILNWIGDFQTYIIMIVDRYILFGLNGLDNIISIPCQYYDIGENEEGNKYPIILREGAYLFIGGLGQAIFGFKRLDYKIKGGFYTPVYKVDYTPNNPEIILTKAKGISGMSQINKEGLWRNNDIGAEVYGAIDLEGFPISRQTIKDNDEISQRMEEYRKNNTYYTPQLYRFIIRDKIKREVLTTTFPEDISQRTMMYRETVSTNNGEYQSGHIELTLYGDFSNELEDLYSTKNLSGKVYLTPRKEELNEVIRGSYDFLIPDLSISNYENIQLDLDGYDIVKRLKTTFLGHSYNYEGMTDIEALQDLCEQAGIDLITNETGIVLKDKGEQDKGTWKFQAKTKIWEAMEKIRNTRGFLLYPDVDGNLIYKDYPDGSSYDFVFDRWSSPVENIKYTNKSIWKSRIYVIGKAGVPFTYTENGKTITVKQGDNLLGVWNNTTLEKEIGYIPYIELDETLQDWESIQRRGDMLDKKFNQRNKVIEFDITDGQDYLGDLWIYKTFLWKDSKHPSIDNKVFLITGYSIDVDAFNIEIHITGEIL